MNRLLYNLLRPSTYGAATLAAVAVAAQYQQQDKQQHQVRRTPPQCHKNIAARIGASSVLAQSPARNYRKERFLQFASIENDGVPYMTPEDFLESVTQEQPRYRQGRKILSRSEMDRILQKTPSLKRGSTKLMRSLGHDGILSYSEYLFLLCTLANSKSGFSIAFNMIDRSRNQSIEKAEFATLNTMVSECRVVEDEEVDALQDTTLMRHFFGRSGKDCLDFTQFVKFMTDLQHEVLEIEFLEFSKGLPTIAESDFARVLLRYTNLSDGAQALYAEKIQEKLVREEGIEFEDFRLFFQFINSLHDMSTALRMYDLAGHAVTEEEFQRAVKACVGYTLAPRVVSTVFLLLDKDGDGNLSSKEFLGILRDRLRRLNPKPKSSYTIMDEFKRCLRREMQQDA